MLLKGVFGHWVRSLELDFVLSQLSLMESHLALDLGCGPGAIGNRLERMGYTVVYLDVARKPGLKAKSLSSFIQASGEHIPLKSECMDLVVAISTIEHVTDDLSLLREVFRILRPGGKLAITTDTDAAIPSRIWSRIKGGASGTHVTDLEKDDAVARKYLFRSIHASNHNVLRFYTKETLRRLLKNMGFRVLEARYLANSKLARFMFEASTFILPCKSTRKNPAYLLMSVIYPFIKVLERNFASDGYIIGTISERPALDRQIAHEQNLVSRGQILERFAKGPSRARPQLTPLIVFLLSIVVTLDVFLDLQLLHNVVWIALILLFLAVGLFLGVPED